MAMVAAGTGLGRERGALREPTWGIQGGPERAGGGPAVPDRRARLHVQRISPTAALVLHFARFKAECAARTWPGARYAHRGTCPSFDERGHIFWGPGSGFGLCKTTVKYQSAHSEWPMPTVPTRAVELTKTQVDQGNLTPAFQVHMEISWR